MTGLGRPAFGAASQAAVEISKCLAFRAKADTRAACPHQGICLFVEPIACTAAECRGYNRAVARVGMTGLGRPLWVCCGAAALNL